ncbi:MAG: hypothetical protein GY820_39565 [Gammaproteobacteria bacterium]|nr:hypothetical protein [Gammaproteobacteria bacterium]
MPYASNDCGFQGRSGHNTEARLDTPGNTYVVGDRTWMYVKAGAAIAAGQIVSPTVSAATVANIETQNNTVEEGVGKPWVYDSGAGLTAQDHVGSFLYINSGTGAGQGKRIVKNTATKIWYSAMYPEIGEADGFETALDTTSDLVIISPFTVVKSIADEEFHIVWGYAPLAITSGYYGYILHRGVGLPITGTDNAAPVAGKYVVPGDNTAGQATGIANTNDLFDATICGIALHAGADDQATPVFMLGK